MSDNENIELDVNLVINRYQQILGENAVRIAEQQIMIDHLSQQLKKFEEPHEESGS